MVGIRSLSSFCTYVGADCVSAHEGSTIYVPKAKADELVAGGLAVLLQDAPPAPSQTKVSSYVPPVVDATKTHEKPPEPEEAEQPPADPASDQAPSPAASPPKRAPVKRAASKRAASKRAAKRPQGESHA